MEKKSKIINLKEKKGEKTEAKIEFKKMAPFAKKILQRKNDTNKKEE